MFMMLLFSQAATANQPSDKEVFLDHAGDPRKGNLDGMLEHGFIRVLTTYNPLFFTFDGIEQNGLIVELTRAFENYLKEQFGKKARHLRVLLLPVSRDKLIQNLLAGKGEIIAANLTITTERVEQVDFSDPLYSDISELVITGPAAPDVKSFDDLILTGLHVRESSSYYEHLTLLNNSRKQEKKRKIPIHKADELLEDHDLLEMVNAGILPAVIVDSHKAELWAQVFTKIKVHDDLAVHSGRSIAWAVRKDTPKLLEAVNGFVKTARKGTLLGNIMINRYLKNTDWVENVRDNKSRQRYEETIEIIKHYSGRYDFDWLMIAAQAYQESKLDQSKRSPAGAIGIMQVRPSTAKDPNVGINNIHEAENNVHAGVKYLRFVRDRYFSSKKIDPVDRLLFSFAAYNAGPANITKARKQASKMGFDPNKWFGHVEVAASRTISREPVIYVRNIYKYYVAYKLIEDIRREREAVLGAGR
ncbi:MAG: transporter substrate-binding domain-containing protein [Gammaproteobacteria bacterium]|nr:transporter substrate-binding domain-containing protein [Gammaproteobacteria bacterium]